jgi:hypothetical protein
MCLIYCRMSPAPAVMPQHLIPLWSLSGTQAGMMAIVPV